MRTQRVALTVLILVVRVAFNYMNNETRVSLFVSGDPLAETVRNVRRQQNDSGNNNSNNNNNNDNNNNNNNRAMLRMRKWSTRRRPRLLKVRDGSVAETLPSFAFNPDPHFVGAWSILHLPPFSVAVVLFRSYLLGLVNLENGRHIVSPSRPRFPHVSLSLFPSRDFFLSLQPPSYAAGSPRSLSPSLWITIVLGIQ